MAEDGGRHAELIIQILMKVLYTGFQANSFINYLLFSASKRSESDVIRRHNGYNIIRSAILAAARLTLLYRVFNVVVQLSLYQATKAMEKAGVDYEILKSVRTPGYLPY